MSQSDTIRICLHDEAPRIGCGWRLVQVLSVGYKWATVRSLDNGARKKFRRREWDAIVSQSAARLERAAA